MAGLQANSPVSDHKVPPRVRTGLTAVREIMNLKNVRGYCPSNAGWIQYSGCVRSIFFANSDRRTNNEFAVPAAHGFGASRQARESLLHSCGIDFSGIAYARIICDFL